MILPMSLSQNLPPIMIDVRYPVPRAAITPKIPLAATAPRVGQKARQNPSDKARWIVSMLMGPMGAAAAKATAAERKNCKGPEWTPESRVSGNMNARDPLNGS
jgi:hypothetical protein